MYQQEQEKRPHRAAQRLSLEDLYDGFYLRILQTLSARKNAKYVSYKKEQVRQFIDEMKIFSHERQSKAEEYLLRWLNTILFQLSGSDNYMTVEEQIYLPLEKEMTIIDMKTQLLIIVIIEKMFPQDKSHDDIFLKMQKRLAALKQQILIKENTKKNVNVSSVSSASNPKIKPPEEYKIQKRAESSEIIIYERQIGIIKKGHISQNTQEDYYQSEEVKIYCFDQSEYINQYSPDQ